MNAFPEPTGPDEEPASASEGVETFTPDQILAIARTQAAVLDPRHRALYATLPPERFFHATDLVAFWLVAAQQSLADARRGRGHRRAYAATVHQLAESTNDVELTAPWPGRTWPTACCLGAPPPEDARRDRPMSASHALESPESESSAASPSLSRSKCWSCNTCTSSCAIVTSRATSSSSPLTTMRSLSGS